LPIPLAARLTYAVALVSALPSAPQRLSAFDLALVAVYLIGITMFGLRFRKKSGAAGTTKAADRSLRSYFLADNTIPWWAIMLSIVSAETSTLTIISIPGVAFAGDFGFLQVVIGYMLGRIVVASLFLPRYFAGEMLTAYQLIDRRFGPFLHKVTAGLFLLTRAAAEGVRVFAVSIVVGIAIGTRDVLSIAIISALTLLYTFEGGMAAVIWTDVVQMIIYLGGTVAAIWSLGHHIPGGWEHIHTVAAVAGKFHMLDFALNLTTAYTFWAGVLGGTFLTMASHGTDQLMVQRMLAARSLRESQLALLSSGVVIFIQFALFLLIGAGLYVFYGQHPAVFASADRIFPTFIVREMPIGVAGLLVAAILAAAMSNLSAALNSLSSATVVDFYMHLRPRADDRERALISKSSTVLWALVLFAIAVYSIGAGGHGHVVVIGLSIASVAYGCLLGVFLLGTLTKFATEGGAALGMVCGFALNLWLWQGAFPVSLGPITIPHVAWTWYVLIGAGATFAIGSVASLLFRKQSSGRSKRAARIAVALLLPLLLPFLLSFRSAAEESASPVQAQTLGGPITARPHRDVSGEVTDFAPVSTLINDGIAAHKLPGAVVLIGHNGHVVFEHAYGDRKLAGEPELDGKPASAEPMTEETIFDMASLTKVLATAPSIMQLYEQGKIASFDDPVDKYLPGFNENHDPERAKVTLRMLLTHTSGEPPDVDLKDPWGLAHPDKAEGLHRTLTTPLMSAPGEVFRYSDINFILLGHLVETLSGESLDVYAQKHIFAPLGMTDTRYLPLAKACGPHRVSGSAVDWAPVPRGRIAFACPQIDWSTSELAQIAPTVHDNEGTAATNPDFDHLLRGTVDDPTSRRMGGVAGHAGVFSTAHDVALYAQALLDKLLHNTGPFPVKQVTLQMMTTPEQPSTVQVATIFTLNSNPDSTLATPILKPTQGTPVRGFGWDINSAFSRPRGAIFPTFPPSQPASATPSFGHTGYTGTSVWIDPNSDAYVVLLANAIHPRGRPTISPLRGDVATAAAQALGLYEPSKNSGGPFVAQSHLDMGGVQSANQAQPATLTGIDVLETTRFAALREAAQRHGGHLRIGLLTNQTGLDSQGRRSIDILAHSLPEVSLTTLFSPEHGLYGTHDDTHIANDIDPTTRLPVISLYGPKESDKHPSREQLKDLDAVVIDLQDVGVRFYTYETLVGYFLEAAAHAHIEIIVLDRPNPLGGVAVQGPISDPGDESYIDFMSIPLRHGMTMGELARFFNANATEVQLTPKLLDAHTLDIGPPVRDERPAVTRPGLHARLTIVPMQHWTRSQYFDQTDLPWTNPSPNLRSLAATTLYPGLGLLDFSNISVGRGSATPFELFGAGTPAKDSITGAQPAAWFDASDVAAALNTRHIPGVSFAATTTSIAEDANHYPYHGQTIQAVRIHVTDRTLLNSPELGIEILSALHRLYPTQFQLEKAARLIANRVTFDALKRGDDPREIARAWNPSLVQFLEARKPFLLYP
jgi:SSS family transporter